ncbi:hypothetical protein PIIN_04609 [Serendipita indica DSM 11827]|uniref:Uncharacterized protein n=1 Tax=Serendipita indica (strain DSM 11827) TaxID=1109443 RepID=G4TH92_SERID|nr:hypothetical protein PIIN_04609 [Serendipita indica DSM 11827]
MTSRTTKEIVSLKHTMPEEAGISSQPSSGSMEETLDLKIVTQLKANRAKREKKAHAELKKDVISGLEQFRANATTRFKRRLEEMTQMHVIYDQERVTLQREIESYWNQILSVHSEFTTFTQEYVEATAKAEDQRSANHLEALSLIERALTDEVKLGDLQ